MQQQPTHVLVECPELIASVRVGVLNALAPLENKNVCAVRFRETRNMRKEDLAWCDIFMCVRGSEDMSARIVREAKRLGRLLLYFLDDDLLHLPPDSLARAYFEYGNHQQALRDILAMSDGLWGVNTLIRDAYLPLCGEKRWISSRVPIQLTKQSSGQEDSVVRVLYAGSVDHQKTVQEVLTPAVRLVLERYGDGIEFTFVGPNPGLDDHPEVLHRPFFENYDHYHKFVHENNFSIGLAPIQMGKFFQCKYYNKFVEYTAIGAVGIYTDSDLYRQIICHEENGLLCANTPNDWAEEIMTLARCPDLRSRCLKNAEALLENEFEPERVAEQLLLQIPELKAFRAPNVSTEQIRLYHPLVFFYWERIRYLFHTYHALALPLIAWKCAKKLIKWILRRASC